MSSQTNFLLAGYWRKKAQKRYENLKADGRLRDELEFWTPKSIDTIDIIR